MTNEEKPLTLDELSDIINKLAQIHGYDAVRGAIKNAVDALNAPSEPSASMEDRWRGWRVAKSAITTWGGNEKMLLCISNILDGDVWEKSSHDTFDEMMSVKPSYVVELHGPEKFKILESMPAEMVRAAGGEK